MIYALEITRPARRGLEVLPLDIRGRIVALARIDALCEDPGPSESHRLKGQFAGLGKLWVGEYRFVYHVDDESRTAGILRVGHQRDLYD